jgi:hypothetical protein
MSADVVFKPLYTRAPVRKGVVFVVCLLAALALAMPASAAGPLYTAIFDLDALAGGPRQALGLARVHASGATMVRVVLNWRAVAPHTRPADFDPANPDDPAYNWGGFDHQVSSVAAANLIPIVTIQHAPAWAEGSGPGQPGTVRPDPVQFGRFARAAATRYSGAFVPGNNPYADPLPRVRYWMAWNEPNRHYFLMPQYEGGRIASGAHYRAMVNHFAAAVHAVDRSNTVIAGGLAPLGRSLAPAPLAFMRSFLSSPVEFDAWSHHPYTSGGPTHRALKRDDVSLGDLPEMRRLLRAAARAGRINSSGPVGFWVTEFSWDSNPPDRRGLSAAVHARWVSEALYRMWQNGVSVVTWFRVEDDSMRESPYQSGFWMTNGRRKRSLTAFRFPVVAFGHRRGIRVWGRTPAGVRGRVLVQVRSGRRWRHLGRVNTNAWGVFSKTYRKRVRRGHVRARFAGEFSLPFSLTPVADRYVNPFGCGGGIRC